MVLAVLLSYLVRRDSQRSVMKLNGVKEKRTPVESHPWAYVHVDLAGDLLHAVVYIYVISLIYWIGAYMSLLSYKSIKLDFNNHIELDCSSIARVVSKGAPFQRSSPLLLNLHDTHNIFTLIPSICSTQSVFSSFNKNQRLEIYGA